MSLPCELIPVTRVAERPGSGNITFSKGGVSGNRKWVSPWYFNDGRTYLDFVQQLLGMTLAGPTGTPAVTYPDSFSPELPWLYCQEVSVAGEDLFGTDGWGRAAYRRAILDCKYVPYERGESFHLAAQMFTCKEGQLNWIGTFEPMPARPQIIAEDQLAVMAAQLFNQITQLKQVLANAGNAGQGLFIPPPLDQGGLQAGDVQQFVIDQRQRRLIEQRIERLEAQLAGVKAKIVKANAGNVPQNVQDGVNNLATYLVALTNWYNNQTALITSSGVPAAKFAQLNAGGNPVAVPVGKVIPLGEYTLERHFVLQPNFGTWIAMMGCTNKSYFLGFPPWTLLFSGLDGKRALMPNGTRCWDITMKFLFNPNGHNFIYRAEKGRFEIVVSSTASTGGWLTSGLTGWTTIATPVHRYLYEPIDYTPFLTYT